VPDSSKLRKTRTKEFARPLCVAIDFLESLPITQEELDLLEFHLTTIIAQIMKLEVEDRED
jgi:hypothetical protein